MHKAQRSDARAARHARSRILCFCRNYKANRNLVPGDCRNKAWMTEV